MANLLSALLTSASLAAAPSSTVQVNLQGLRNAKGVIHACLTQDRATFPNCNHDPRAIQRTILASTHELHFDDVPPGTYALIVFHDENRNQKLDKLFGVPREGFGFSRNPVIRFSAPTYDSVAVDLPRGLTRLSVRLQYLL